MFAILLIEDNRETVLEHYESTPQPHPIDLDLFIRHRADWYYVRGWVNHRGQVQDFAVIPRFILTKYYEHDPDKIRTNWDQIVPKREAP